MTALYSLLHLLVDCICAAAMFGGFLTGEKAYFYILIYNFCAFALQMPLGAAADMLRTKRRDAALVLATAGVLCTIAGAFTHPAVLGAGNALFHVGGGLGSIQEDRERNRKGRGLGVFVAPGALGLYLGTLAAGTGLWKIRLAGLCALTAGVCLWAYAVSRGAAAGEHGEAEVAAGGRHKGKGKGTGDLKAGSGGDKGHGGTQAGYIRLIVCCVAVVILRSCVSMGVSFPRESGLLAGILAVSAVVAGKMAGGFAAAGYGVHKTAVVSLGAAALCYLFSGCMPAGIAALFLFNMTMPITLYLTVCAMPRSPGFAFGLLTFALFLGFLPGYFGLLPESGGNLLGCAGSALSLILLWVGTGGKGRKRDIGPQT